MALISVAAHIEYSYCSDLDGLRLSQPAALNRNSVMPIKNSTQKGFTSTTDYY